VLRIIILAVAVYLGWHYFGWRGAAGVVGAYILWLIIVNVASSITGGVNARTARGHAAELMHHKLTDEEKAHYSAAREHERAMTDHRAQFDPELRKRP
jgi:hypothetical protein